METLLLRVLVMVCAVGLTLECGAGGAAGGGGGDGGLASLLGGTGGGGGDVGKCSPKFRQLH